MNLAIINYPYALQSAVYGLNEMFEMANSFCKERQLNVDIINPDKIKSVTRGKNKYTVVILPPSLTSEFYTKPSPMLVDWLRKRHSEGCILSSACAGAFIIASTGLLEGRKVTTHWGLEILFREHFPGVKLDINQIMINDTDIITAGGVMSWLDLGLELVAQFTTPAVMRQLGKMLVVDTGKREQKYYQQFNPKLTHGDELILGVQRKLQTEYSSAIRISKLAEECHLTERTFLRRFVKATGLKPTEYLQKVRIQNVCYLLENTQDTFESIALNSGYEDISACRKIFVRIMGLTPREFKKRFVSSII